MNLETAPNSQASLNQDSSLRYITHRIRQSLELQDILTATVAEVRSFLHADRVKIYKFHADGSGQVIAESITNQRLPSLLGLNFPAADIPLEARQMLVKTRVRSIVDTAAQQIGQSGQRYDETGKIDFENICYRPVDPCHAEYLTAMGVKSSLVVPILDQEHLWGLLVSHYVESRAVSASELQDVQFVTDQLAIAIAQSTLIAQVREKARWEATINYVSTLLHSLSTVQLQAALNETVEAFNGAGGRLYLKTNSLAVQSDFARKLAEQSATSIGSVRLYTTGQQPTIPAHAPSTIFEEYSVWQTYFKSGQRTSWAIADLYKQGRLNSLQSAFRPTKLCGILMLPLWYRQQLLGFLSIFREPIDTEIFWAGQVDADYQRVQAQLSFEVCKETRIGQVLPWTKAEIALAETLASHFATAIQQYETHQHLQLLNANLEKQVAERTVKLHRQTEQLTQTLHELQQAQTQLIQTEKMSSLGELVAGVAHEINNPVNFIYGNLKHVSDYTQDLLTLLSLYEQTFPDPGQEIAAQAAEIDLEFLLQDLPKTLSSMKIGADRIRQIVLSLRNFSRLDQVEMKPVDIHVGIDSTVMILQHRLKATAVRIGDVEYHRPDIKLIKDYGNLPLVECHAGQLNQVFMNLLSNAIDALEENGAMGRQADGEITAAEIKISTQALGSDRVVIYIADNGLGMPESVRAQIFNPFFTTKPAGKGTGMGLSISYQIVVEKHGGVLRCDSKSGQGTEFWIEIPIQSVHPPS